MALMKVAVAVAMVAMLFTTFSVFSKRSISARANQGVTKEMSVENATSSGTTETKDTCGAVSSLGSVCTPHATKGVHGLGLTITKDHAACKDQCTIDYGSMMGLPYCKCPIKDQNCASPSDVHHPWPGAKYMSWNPLPGMPFVQGYSYTFMVKVNANKNVAYLDTTSKPPKWVDVENSFIDIEAVIPYQKIPQQDEEKKKCTKNMNLCDASQAADFMKKCLTKKYGWS